MKELQGKGSHDLIFSKNNTKNSDFLVIILIYVCIILVLLIYYIARCK